MTKFLLYVHKRLFAQEYGRQEMLDILARKTLKSVARSTGARIHANRWLKTLDFMYRSTGSDDTHTSDELTKFKQDFTAALMKYERTHPTSIKRTLLVMDYLSYRVTNNQDEFIRVMNYAKDEFVLRDDSTWFLEVMSKFGFDIADCGHIHRRGDVSTLFGNAEIYNATETACSNCVDALVRDGVRVPDGYSYYLLTEFAVTVRTSSGDRLMDRRQDNVQYNERYACWTDGSWSPYVNLIGSYHSSKSTGFEIIDSAWFRRHRRAFGLELEVQARGVESNTAAGKIHDVLNPTGRKGEYCYFERDGSIGDGFEIVTQPAGLDIHRDKLALFLNSPDLKRGLRSHEGGSCGLHIHVGRQYVTQAQIYRVQSFLNDIRNEGLVRKISRRYGNSYCRIKHEMAKLSPMGKHSSERYEALNVTGRETIEFRIFRGSLRYESVIAALEFVDALLNFCMPGQTSIMDFNSIGFRKFLANPQQSADTKFLRSYLSINANTDNEQQIAA
jgi:hypothetical protein